MTKNLSEIEGARLAYNAGKVLPDKTGWAVNDGDLHLQFWYPFRVHFFSSFIGYILVKNWV